MARPSDGISGPAVDGAGIRGRNVILTIFVFVVEAKVGAFDDFDRFQSPSRFGDRKRPADTLQVLRQTSFIPDVQLIASIGNIRDRDASGVIRQSKIRSVHGDDGRAHLRVNVAEEIAHSYAVEAHCLTGSGFIESKVKSLSIKKRKNIVEERVSIGELDAGARLNDKNVRVEALVNLCDLRGGMRGGRCGGRSIIRGEGCKPDDNVGRIGAVAGRCGFPGRF